MPRIHGFGYRVLQKIRDIVQEQGLRRTKSGAPCRPWRSVAWKPSKLKVHCWDATPEVFKTQSSLL